jgi:methylated-DNA-[protein]-cysteine S-methyltransferase
MMEKAEIDSPVGPLVLESGAGGLRRLEFGPGGRKDRERPDRGTGQPAGVIELVRRQLEAYFAGRLRRFSVPLAPEGTPFQLAVWRALQEIPYGETISYGELARRIGDPKAVRAVGAANGANPIAIISPCHRVIGANGSLVGFGGGLAVKRALLDLERGERRLI